MKSVFDLAHQQGDLDSRVVVALERLTHLFRVKLWQENRRHGLSPIQLQILIHLLYHRRDLCTVSQLAREFNLTAPTISDAVRILEEKRLLESHRDVRDRRISTLALTARGRTIAREAGLFANDLKHRVARLDPEVKATVLAALLQTIAGLQEDGIISPARMCLSCRFYERRDAEHFQCKLLQKTLPARDLRVDCPEFQPLAV
jgi:DNA-binding MarR family transcriptional regulator